MSIATIKLPINYHSYPVVMANSNQIKELTFFYGRWLDDKCTDLTDRVDMVCYYTGYREGCV